MRYYHDGTSLGRSKVNWCILKKELGSHLLQEILYHTYLHQSKVGTIFERDDEIIEEYTDWFNIYVPENPDETAQIYNETNKNNIEDLNHEFPTASSKGNNDNCTPLLSIAFSNSS